MLTREQAHRVYDILVATVGANPDVYERDSFIDYAMSDDPCEYRFSGILGFGGKCYFSKLMGKIRVSVGYYIEDSTPDRDAAKLMANNLLAEMFS